MKIKIRETPKYCSLTKDKFKNRIDLSAKGSFEIKTYSFSRMAEKGGEMKLSSRYTKTDKTESVIIDYEFKGLDWIYVDGRDLIINIDSKENINLKAIKVDSSVGKNAAGQINNLLGSNRSSTLSNLSDVEVTEIGYYILTPKELDSICNAKKIEFQINSKKIVLESNETTSKKLHVILRSLHYDLFSSKTYESYLEENNKLASGSGCFIATASMGSYNNPVVIDLRVFRDEWLLRRNWGVKFTDLYYKYGPRLATLIENSKILKKITFYLIVNPLYYIIFKIFRFKNEK